MSPSVNSPRRLRAFPGAVAALRHNYLGHRPPKSITALSRCLLPVVETTLLPSHVSGQESIRHWSLSTLSCTITAFILLYSCPGMFQAQLKDLVEAAEKIKPKPCELPEAEVPPGASKHEGGGVVRSVGGSEGGGGASSDENYWPHWLAISLFIQELWFLLQHANVLFNPLCQRLDRGYGIALVSGSAEPGL